MKVQPSKSLPPLQTRRRCDIICRAGSTPPKTNHPQIEDNAVQTKKSQRNVYLDLFKFFLSFMIIAIHLAGESYPHFPLYRLSVPMFFMISGYFCYSNSAERVMQKARGLIPRTPKYMAVVLAKFFTFPNLMAKCAAVFAVSFLIYEAAYLIGMLIAYKKKAKQEA